MYIELERLSRICCHCTDFRAVTDVYKCKWQHRRVLIISVFCLKHVRKNHWSQRHNFGLYLVLKNCCRLRYFSEPSTKRLIANGNVGHRVRFSENFRMNSLSLSHSGSPGIIPFEILIDTSPLGKKNHFQPTNESSHLPQRRTWFSPSGALTIFWLVQIPVLFLVETNNWPIMKKFIRFCWENFGVPVHMRS